MSFLPQKTGSCLDNNDDDLTEEKEQAELEINTTREVINKGSRKKQTKKQSRGRALKSKTDTSRFTDQFFLDEIVFATKTGYAPWPACILDIKSETYYVCFFGSGEMFVFTQMSRIKPLLKYF